jgi:hypothetical protein
MSDPKPIDYNNTKRILQNAVDDCSVPEVRKVLEELRDSVLRGGQRHHKDGSRCYAPKCARAHSLLDHTPAQGSAG